jgi:hypothetical protein
MFRAVILFGLATILFAFSHWLWLSVAAMVVMGAADVISVVIRSSWSDRHARCHARARRRRELALRRHLQSAGRIQIRRHGRPLRRRAGGDPRRGRTIAVALLWMRLFPALRDADTLEGFRTEPTPPGVAG